MSTVPTNGYLDTVLTYKSWFPATYRRNIWPIRRAWIGRYARDAKISSLQATATTGTTHARTRTRVHAFPQASLKSLPTMARDRRPSSSDNEQCWHRRCQPTPSGTETAAASPPQPPSILSPSFSDPSVSLDGSSTQKKVGFPCRLHNRPTPAGQPLDPDRVDARKDPIYVTRPDLTKGGCRRKGVQPAVTPSHLDTDRFDGR